MFRTHWISLDVRLHAALFVIIICYTSFTSSNLTDNCLQCMSKVYDGEARVGMECTDGHCGPYYISAAYFQSSILNTGANRVTFTDIDYQGCTKQWNCSVNVVRSFMELWALQCTQTYTPTCKDYTRIHWAQSSAGCLPQEDDFTEACLTTSTDRVDACCQDLEDGCD